MATSFAKKVFQSMIEGTPEINFVDPGEFRSEGIVTSANDFFKLLVEANDVFNKTFNISDRDKLIFAEDIPTELVQRLNNEVASTTITDSTLRDLRLVTYSASEQPGSKGAHRPGEPGIKTIKYSFAEVYDDPEYTGYSIIRYKKEIEATISFKVWGMHYEDIRNRSSLLRDVINNSTWYFKHKGLDQIVWNGAFEEEKWDHMQMVKNKTEKYIVTYNEIKEVREKNIEQIVLEFGLQR